MNLKNLRTDLAIEQPIFKKGKTNKIKNNEIIVYHTKVNEYDYTTISYQDINNIKEYKEIEKILIKELNNYINLKENDHILVIGLGNKNSTPDSLGPNTTENILVTKYLFSLGEVEKGYSNVASFIPNVTGNTGIESSRMIKSIIKETKSNKVIVIDSLKTNNINRLGKTIQITNKGISPGSGVGNNREEISKKTMNIDIIAIGIPTVVDIESIIKDYIDNDVYIEENLIVTPTNIDLLIEKHSILISKAINSSLHKNYIRQNIL